MNVASLVFLSVANGISKDSLRKHIFKEPKKLISLLATVKKLLKKISFKAPLHVFFEKKKLQIFRKVNDLAISIFMEQQYGPEYSQAITHCRTLTLLIWCRLAEIKEDYKKTTRARTLVKD